MNPLKRRTRLKRLKNGDYLRYRGRDRAMHLYTGEDARVIDLLVKYGGRVK